MNGKHAFLMLLLPVLCVLLSVSWAADQRLISVRKLEMFVDELPDMPRIRGYDLRDGVPEPRTMKIGMFEKKWKFHRDIPATRVFAYGEAPETATVPGPTIESLRGVETNVVWENHLPSKHILPWDPTIPTAKPRTGVPTVVHLHGGIHAAHSDGHAEAWFSDGFKERGPAWTTKTYSYPNMQHPGSLWYHDHAMGLTRVNLLAGLVGSYIIRHPEVEKPLGLPSTGEFDRPLVLFDRSFRVDGSIFMNSTGNNPSIHPQWQPEYFGDAIIVNGKAWPKLTVRRRKYRFRIINASNARFFRLFFTNGMNFIHVGSDSAYLPRPRTNRKFLLGPSEIADIVVDFSDSPSHDVVLANDAPYPFPSGDPADKFNGRVMKFVISGKAEVDESRVPKKLLGYRRPKLTEAAETRYIAMYEYTSPSDEPTHLYLNGKPYDAPATETPREGTTEIWNVINLTEDNHPLHIHLGLFVVKEQRELVKAEEFTDCMTRHNDAIKCNVSRYARGKKIPVPVNERGWKNVFKMRPGCVTKILVRFAYVDTGSRYLFDATAAPGYVYHCHILDHEDNMMMRPLKIIAHNQTALDRDTRYKG